MNVVNGTKISHRGVLAEKSFKFIQKQTLRLNQIITSSITFPVTRYKSQYDFNDKFDCHLISHFLH